MSYLLSTDLDSPTSVPYFLWDAPMTVAELKKKLASASETERMRLLGKVLREARDSDVWQFTTPQELVETWDKIERHLGRRRGFWKFLVAQWQELGLIV